jgi:hypothetical protein
LENAFIYDHTDLNPQLSSRLSTGTQSSRRSTRTSVPSSQKGTLSTTSDSRASTPRSTQHEKRKDDEDESRESDSQSNDESIVINDWGENLRIDQQHRSESEFRDTPRDGALDLQSRLAAARVSNSNRQTFIPIDKIEALMTEENVRQELSKHKRKLSEDMEKAILHAVCTHSSMNTKDTSIQVANNSRQKIFAILVLLDKAEEIARFMRAHIADSDLPFAKVGSSQLACRGGQLFSGFDDWTPEITDSLLDHQTEVTVPYFSISPKASHYSFENSIVLPFESKGAISRGSYSEVYKVKIHPAHHSFSPMTNGPSDTFAVKRLTATRKKDFEHEAAILRKISGQHNHLISLLATYRHGSSYHFVFPWADGDLRSFWKQNREPERVSLNLSSWLAEQCLGVAQALTQLHNPSSSSEEHQFYRHGDLKPENILFFKADDSIGTLKIADVGLARAYSTYEGQPREERCTPTYRAPESDLASSMSPKYDVWSFGCLLLEFATWAIAGWDAVEHTFPTARATALSRYNDFSNDDSFFEIRRDGDSGVKQAHIKDSVTEVRFIFMSFSFAFDCIANIE